MKIPKVGLNKDTLLNELKICKKNDLDWRTGKTFGYVYHAGNDVEEIGKHAYMLYLTENALEPSIYPSLLKFENEIVEMAISHLNGDSNHAAGNFTSGGTESCLLSVKAARDWARDTKPTIKQPEIIIPETAHGAFHKAAHYFGLKVNIVPVNNSFKADPKLTEQFINENTIMLVGSAISYPYGVVDPIPELGKIALNYDLWLHVDSCMGGFLLPYFKRLGSAVTEFDLSVPGVSSISMDYHKYAFCPKGSSVILYKSKKLRKYQIFVCSNWNGYTIINPTIQSSKSGGPVAATWAVLHYLGDNGYLEIAKKIQHATKTIINEIKKMEEFEILGSPEMNLISFTSNKIDVFDVIDRMRKLGWYIQPQHRYESHQENIHLSISHQHLSKAKEFINDLKQCALKSNPISRHKYLDEPYDDKTNSKSNFNEKFYKETFQRLCPLNKESSSTSWSEFNNLMNQMDSKCKNAYLAELTNDIYKL